MTTNTNTPNGVVVSTGISAGPALLLPAIQGYRG